jgi:hypothetical protein
MRPVMGQRGSTMRLLHGTGSGGQLALGLLASAFLGSALFAQESSPAPLVPPDQGYAGFTLALVESRAPVDVTGHKASFNTGSFEVFYGWKPSRDWAVQAGVGAFGAFPKGDGTTTWHRSVQDGTMEALGWWGLGPQTRLTLKAGLALWTASWGYAGQGSAPASARNRDSGLTPLAGLGVDLDLSPQWTLRIEGEALLKVLDAPVERVGCGLLYRF